MCVVHICQSRFFVDISTFESHVWETQREKSMRMGHQPYFMHTNFFLRLSSRWVVFLWVCCCGHSDSKFAEFCLPFPTWPLCCHRVFHTQFPCPVQCQDFHHYPWLIRDDCPRSHLTRTHARTQHWFNCNPKQLQFSNQINEHTHTRSYTRTGVQHTRTHTCTHQYICGMVLVAVVACVLTCSLARARYLRESIWIGFMFYFLFTSRAWKQIEIVWSDPKWQTQIGWGQKRYGVETPHTKTPNSSQQNAHKHYLLSVRLRVCVWVWKKRHHHN